MPMIRMNGHRQELAYYHITSNIDEYISDMRINTLKCVTSITVSKTLFKEKYMLILQSHHGSLPAP